MSNGRLSSNRPNSRSSQTSRTFYLAFAACVWLCSGCAHVGPMQADAKLKEQAAVAYRRAGQPLPAGPLGRDYERGWKQAYIDQVRGTSRSTPPLPPEVGSLDRTGNAAAHRRAAAWFAGYQRGQSRCGSVAAAPDAGWQHWQADAQANTTQAAVAQPAPTQPNRSQVSHRGIDRPVAY